MKKKHFAASVPGFIVLVQENTMLYRSIDDNGLMCEVDDLYSDDVLSIVIAHHDNNCTYVLYDTDCSWTYSSNVKKT